MSSNVPDETVSPRVWKMLVDINAKLELVLEKLNLENEGLTQCGKYSREYQRVGNPFFSGPPGRDREYSSNSRCCFRSIPPSGSLLTASWSGLKRRMSGRYETSLRFIDLVDEVRDVIIQYTLEATAGDHPAAAGLMQSMDRATAL